MELFNPILILGESRIGKTFLIKNILSRIDNKVKVVFAKEDEYDNVEFHNDFRVKDLLQDNSVIVIEDLPRLMRKSKRMWKYILELLTQTGHYKSYVLISCQTDEGVDLRFIRKFGAVIFFKNNLSYRKWRIILSPFYTNRSDLSKVASSLVKKVYGLDFFNFIILDMRTMKFLGEFRNDDMNAIDKVLYSLDNVINDGRDLLDLVERKAIVDPEKERKKIDSKSLILQKFKEGKDIFEISNELNLSISYVRYVKSMLTKQGLLKKEPKYMKVLEDLKNGIKDEEIISKYKISSSYLRYLKFIHNHHFQ
jgi:hypothetical protein